jgi:hypothetical protein
MRARRQRDCWWLNPMSSPSNRHGRCVRLTMMSIRDFHAVILPNRVGAGHCRWSLCNGADRSEHFIAGRGPSFRIPDASRWRLSGQVNLISQTHGGFTSPYHADNSLRPQREQTLSRLWTIYTRPDYRATPKCCSTSRALVAFRGAVDPAATLSLQGWTEHIRSGNGRG